QGARTSHANVLWLLTSTPTSEHYANLQELVNWLEQKDQAHLVGLGLEFVPEAAPEARLDVLRACFNAGLPAAIWVRHADCLRRLREVVQGFLQNRSLAELPELVRVRRGEPGHLGQRLTLFWDDPFRQVGPLQPVKR